MVAQNLSAAFLKSRIPHQRVREHYGNENELGNKAQSDEATQQ
jgi:hypothetical protein